MSSATTAEPIEMLTGKWVHGTFNHVLDGSRSQGRMQEGADGAKAPPKFPDKNYLLIQFKIRSSALHYINKYIA